MVQEHVYETLAWEAFMESDDVLRPVVKELIRSAVVTACVELTAAIGRQAVQDAIMIHRGGGLKGYSIKAKRALKPGELVLAPLTTSASRVQEVAASGWAPAVAVKYDGVETQVYLTTSFSLPSLDPLAVASPAVAMAGALSKCAFPEVGLLTAHSWKATTHNPWPFWGVKRTSTRDDANLEFAAVAVNQVVAFNGGVVLDAPKVKTVELSLPVLRNFKAIERGEELVAEWVNRDPVKPKEKKAPMVKTWLDDLPKSKKNKTA